jgi:IclR family acetate operon transcriptional repressor
MTKKLKSVRFGQDTENSPSRLLERALGVVELLSANAHGLQLFEIAARLNMPRSATHRVLTNLAALGYVRQERQLGAYQLTAKIASLAFSFLAGSGITDLAQPILDRMAQASKELVRLAMVDGHELVWVAKSQGSTYGLRYDPDMGQVGRLSCSASGLAWLSCLPEEAAIALIEKQGYGMRKDFGPRAPETRSAVLRYLRQARKRGFSLVVQTYSAWMNALAAPIRNPQSGEVIGTVVIAGPHLRLTEDKMISFSSLLLEGAQDLALAMMTTPGHLYRQSSSKSNFFGKPRTRSTTS